MESEVQARVDVLESEVKLQRQHSINLEQEKLKLAADIDEVKETIERLDVTRHRRVD